MNRTATTTRTTVVGAPKPVAQRAMRAVPLALGLLTASCVIGGFSLGVYLPNLHNGMIAATFTAVGLFVLSRRPGNREGWLFVATGAAEAVMFLGRQYGLLATAAGTVGAPPAVIWATWFGVWPLALILVLVGVTLMSFPDGHLPSRHWRPVVVAMAAVGAMLSVTSALWPVEYTENSLAVPPPFHVAGYDTAQRVWNVAGSACYVLFQVTWVTAAIVRLRRARGDEVRQLRWFVYAVAMGAVAMAFGVAVFHTAIVGVLAAPLVAVAAGAAIVKYRLYDIDPVINKTLVLGTMATLVTAGYIGVVVVVGRFIGISAARHPVWPIFATAVVAVGFEPARRRVQAWADRLVYGRRPTPYETLARLSTRLSGGGPHDDVFTELATAVADGVGAAEVTLWVGPADRLVAVASWPPGPPIPSVPRELASLDNDGATHVVPIVHRTKVRGAVTLTTAPGEVLTTTEDRLLHDLAAQAGLILDNVGLGVELQQRLQQIAAQAAELQAAAKRIVAAQYEARRTIERDLHDGAQQRLVTLALSLQALSERAGSSGDEALAKEAADARRELSEALAELRELARGIHPAILSQEGLDAAVGYLAERAPIPARLDMGVDQRLGQDIEATAYFAVSEALTNAARHSHASRIDITGRLHDGRLRIEVADNGRGGVDGRWGHGLQGLVDRLATLNGRLMVDSPVGGGTRVVVEIPCE
jgi:signal transduction histidine kinase